jgi:orotate phosphoribosyltransferase
MENLKDKFIEYALQNHVLQFGNFTLKSGRKSPYFFNMGKLNHADSLSFLGKCYAEKIHSLDLNCNIVFGPAYKGIPLATATVIQLHNIFGKNMSYSFNRKEVKDHGEGGNIVGANLEGNVVIVDDVITKGTAIKESIEIINKTSAKISAIIVALDRQEKGDSNKYAISQIEDEYNIPVHSIIDAQDIFNYAKTNLDTKVIESIDNYQELYC